MSRETLLPKLADHVLEEGLAAASLRPLAKAAQTSDRMLIYHFGSKDALMAQLLEHLAALYTQMLESAFAMDRAPSRSELAARVLKITQQDSFRPYLALWWEIVAGAARGNADFRDPAAEIMERLLEWVQNHLPANDPDPAEGAKLVLTVIEGALMLDAIGRGNIGQGALAPLGDTA